MALRREGLPEHARRLKSHGFAYGRALPLLGNIPKVVPPALAEDGLL